MTDAGIRCPRIVLAATLACFTVLCGPAAGVAGAAEAAPPAGSDAVIEKIREIIHEDGGDSAWGVEPPAAEIASRGEPFAATVLSGAGHAMGDRQGHREVPAENPEMRGQRPARHHCSSSPGLNVGARRPSLRASCCVAR